MTDQPDFVDPDRFSDWRFLARSGLGETWVALDSRTTRDMVVKFRRLPPSGLDATLGLTQLPDSPHLQRLHDVIRQDGETVALIQDYVPGRTLRDRLRQTGPLTADDSLQIARDILTGLRTVHASGNVHRDVSPDNIVLADHGAVLIDFDAIGRLTEQSTIGQTTVGGDFAGKPRYMSPEQITAAPQSAAVDIWAVGAVLYECISGETVRKGHSIHDLVKGLGELPDVSAVPARVQSLLTAMLAPDPGARPNAQEAIGQIDAILELPVSAPGGDPWSLSDAPAAPADVPQPAHPPAPASPVPAPARPRPGRGGTWPVLFAFLLLAALLAVAWLSGVLDMLMALIGNATNPTAPDTGTLPNTGTGPVFGGVSMRHLALILIGIALAISSLFIARLIRARAAETEVALPFRALDMINAPDARDRLAETICLRIDAYREMAGRAAEDMLTVTMVALANEFANADSADQRLQALQMLNELHGKVSRSLRPWWMNYETLVARALSLTTLVAGVAAAVQGVRGLF